MILTDMYMYYRYMHIVYIYIFVYILYIAPIVDFVLTEIHHKNIYTIHHIMEIELLREPYLYGETYQSQIITTYDVVQQVLFACSSFDSRLG